MFNLAHRPLQCGLSRGRSFDPWDGVPRQAGSAECSFHHLSPADDRGHGLRDRRTGGEVDTRPAARG